MSTAPFVSLVDRIPPSNLEAEMALLGSVLVDKEMMAAVSEIVRPNDFYASLHETIYLALYALYESGKPLDKVALAEELRSRGMLDKVGGLAYLSSLMDTVPTAASAEYYAKIMREKASLRGLIHAGTRITQLGYESEDDVPAAIDEVQQIIAAISSRDQNGKTGELETVDAAELLAADYAEPRFTIEHLVGERGITLVSSDTGGGKTATLINASVALALGERVAGRFATVASDRPVLFVNGEMGGDLLQQYLHQAVAAFAAPLLAGRIYFEGAGGLATFRFRPADCARLERLVERLDPVLVIFDTMRALFEVDENDAGDVRRPFAYLRQSQRHQRAALTAEAAALVDIAMATAQLLRVSYDLGRRFVGAFL